MKTYFVIFLICIVSDIGCFSNCDVCGKEYSRTKRAKYYSHAPPKIFKIPPMSAPVIGPFSYTPPPYLINSGIAGNPRHYQVSDYANGLADEDIQNIVKYLHKQDLEKNVEVAAEKGVYSPRYRPLTQHKYNAEYDSNQYKEHRPKYKEFNEEYDIKGFPYSNVNNEIKPNNLENRKPFSNYFHKNPDNLPFDSFYNMKALVNDMSLQEQATFLDAFIQKEMNGFRPNKNINSNSLIIQEGSLRRPIYNQNIREQDFEISPTNNFPKVVKVTPSSYKLENFGDLPLMNFDDSKLDTVNSYNVPHYTVTQPKSAPQQPSLETLPPLESAPQQTAGRDQSDAHLVAIKIWTHKSKGTAYTVNEDGTLTLEKPLRPKLKFP